MSHGQKQVFAIFQMQEERAWLAEPCTRSPLAGLMARDPAAADALPYEPEYVYERQSVRRPRGAREIGISSVRGGTIVGDHEVIFAGRDEVIELRHSAQSREVFANGAVQAAKFLSGKAPGLYSMDDLLAAIL